MNIFLKMLNSVLGLINQLPEKQKIRTSPMYRSSPPKTKMKKTSPKIKPIRRQGPRRSEETIFNHPRR